MITRRQVRLKRWLTTVNLPALELPQVAVALPPGVIADAWPVCGRRYPRSVRWTVNTARTLVWFVWQLHYLIPGRPLKAIFRAGWNVGAALQMFVATALALGLFLAVTVPIWATVGLVKGAAWVVLIRHGWQPRLPVTDIIHKR